MFRRISAILLSALVMVALAANVALAQPANRDGCVPDADPLLCDKGQPGSDEPKVTGTPVDADCWGEVTHQFAQLGDHGLGDHSSGFGEPRDGVGNVANNDDDLGDDPFNHGQVVGPQVPGVDPCVDDPDSAA
jgi:hypothetical protein